MARIRKKRKRRQKVDEGALKGAFNAALGIPEGSLRRAGENQRASDRARTPGSSLSRSTALTKFFK